MQLELSKHGFGSFRFWSIWMREGSLNCTSLWRQLFDAVFSM